MIAVVTNCSKAYNNYIIEKGLTSKEAKQVSIRKDLKNKTFSSIVKIKGWENVPTVILNEIVITPKSSSK